MGGGAAPLVSTGVPVPLRLLGSGAGDPHVPSAQASAYQGSSSLEESLENLLPRKWLCLLRGRARRGAWVLPPRRGLRRPEGETAPAPGCNTQGENTGRVRPVWHSWHTAPVAQAEAVLLAGSGRSELQTCRKVAAIRKSTGNVLSPSWQRKTGTPKAEPPWL